MAFVTKIN